MSSRCKHFTRRTTVVHLHGAGHEGVGEDVSYEEDLQLAFTDDALPDLTGEHTLDSFSALVADQPGYRPWGLESAALDLALRQAGRSLADAVGREPQPVRFVVSQNKVRELLDLYPALRFKLDASDSWTDEIVAELAATGAVDVVDLKGLYEGDWLDATPSAELYGRVAEGFPRRLARGRAAERRDPAGARAAPPPAHLGLPDPLGRRRRGAALPARVPELEAVALRLRPAALRLLRLLRRARASRSTAAASSSSGPAAARSSTWRRSSTRTRRTTWRRRSTTRAARGRACRRARCRPASREPGFR